MNGIRLSFEPIATAPKLQAAHITLTRPPLNILDIPTIHELTEAVEEADVKRDVHAIVLAAEGDKVFSAGVDMRDHTPDRVAEMLQTFHAVFRVLAGTDKLTVALVRGLCLGGGCELATFCDFVVAADDAQFGLPEIELACFPPVAAASFPRLVGDKKAFELVLTGKRLSAFEAVDIGLISRVVPVNEFDHCINTVLAGFFTNSAVALRLAKVALRLGFAEEFGRRLELIEDLYRRELAPTHDAEEGVSAFLAKRPAVWTHS